MKTIIILLAVLYLIEATSYTREENRGSVYHSDHYQRETHIDYNRHQMEKMDEIINLLREISLNLKRPAIPNITYVPYPILERHRNNKTDYGVENPIRNTNLKNNNNVIPEYPKPLEKTSAPTEQDNERRRCALASLACCIHEQTQRNMCLNYMNCPVITNFDVVCSNEIKEFAMTLINKEREN